MRLSSPLCGIPIEIESDHPLVRRMAAGLWAPAGAAATGDGIRVRIVIEPGGVDTAWPERDLTWSIEDAVTAFEAGSAARGRVDVASGLASIHLREGLLGRDVALAGRLALEVPVTILLTGRGYAPVHAGAVVLDGRAVVVRGASGAGKSTLVAAARQAGFEVLGDESVLVARCRPDGLTASVRDLALTDDTVRLLSLEDLVAPSWAHGTRKHRLPAVDPLAATPASRVAAHVATVLLGARRAPRTELVPLERGEFLSLFAAGEIPQERATRAIRDEVLDGWLARPAGRLDGAADLGAAIGILKSLASAP